MTYTELTALLQEYLQNTSTEFTSAIPDIVRLAEDRIYQGVEFPSLKKNGSLSIVSGRATVALPTDLKSISSISVISGGTYSYLLEKDVSFIREAFPTPTTTGAPRFYARYDEDTILVGPTPGSGYTGSIHYIYEPESIVDAETSWLGDNCESVLFYACLLEAYIYMKGEADLIALYKARYDEALGRLKVLGEGSAKRDDFRIDLPRVPQT